VNNSSKRRRSKTSHRELKEGVLVVTRKTGKLRKQIESSGTIFQVSSVWPVQHSSNVEEHPEIYDGARVEFLLKENGQPCELRFPEIGVPDSRSVAIVEYYYIDQGKAQRIDEGTNAPSVRFYESDLAIQDWVPVREEAILYNPKQGNREIIPLENCNDPRKIRDCAGHDWPSVYMPVAAKYLKTLPDQDQLNWLKKRSEFLQKPTKYQWWRGVTLSVRGSVEVLDFTPESELPEVLTTLLAELKNEPHDIQSEWLGGRTKFLHRVSANAWGLLSPEVAWDYGYWPNFTPKVKVDLVAKMISQKPVLDLLERMTEKSVDLLVESSLHALFERIVESPEMDVIRHPVAWRVLKRDSMHLGAIDRDVVFRSSVLVTAVCRYPEIVRELRQFDIPQGNLLAEVAIRAEFLLNQNTPLSGRFEFKRLEPEDMILAAIYMPNKANGAKLFERAVCRSDWSWGALKSKHTGDSKWWRNFLVSGIQPRIAEIAFGELHKTLELENNLTDLNLDVIKVLKNWSLSEVEELFFQNPEKVSEDWMDDHCRYDVKSNLFYRSKAMKVGLRGFFIELKKELSAGRNVRFPGFVFYDSSESGCSWSYVGELDPGSVPERLRNNVRVAPFFFTMPESHRLEFPTDARSESAGSLSRFLSEFFPADQTKGRLDDICHPIIPLLRIGGLVKMDHLSKLQKLLLRAFEKERKFDDTSDFKQPLERLLWNSINRLVIELRGTGYTAKKIELLLKEAIRLLNNPWMPVVLARVGNVPLLEHWIRDVLMVINEHWDQIRCPQCIGNGNTIWFDLPSCRCSAEAALIGDLNCTCGFSGKVTLITHCHSCEAYPLVIGKNELCSDCRGLKCSCGACKKHCSRTCRRA